MQLNRRCELRKGVFVLIWARVQRVYVRSVSSIVFIGGDGRIMLSFCEVFSDYSGV